MKVWEVAVELNMDSSNVVKIEIEASTEIKLVLMLKLKLVRNIILTLLNQ